MAWRLRLVPVTTNIDFFKAQYVTFGASMVAMAASVLLVLVMGAEPWHRLQGRHHDPHRIDHARGCGGLPAGAGAA